MENKRIVRTFDLCTVSVEKEKHKFRASLMFSKTFNNFLQICQKIDWTWPIYIYIYIYIYRCIYIYIYIKRRYVNKNNVIHKRLNFLTKIIVTASEGNFTISEAKFHSLAFIVAEWQNLGLSCELVGFRSQLQDFARLATLKSCDTAKQSLCGLLYIWYIFKRCIR